MTVDVAEFDALAESCPRHLGRCAYPADDPARCSYCHRPWVTITGRDAETVPDHLTAHAAVEKSNAARVVRDAAKAPRHPLTARGRDETSRGVPA